MRIGVIGAGKLGLTFALLCEKNGYDVIVSDVREDYIQNLKQKVCLTNEPLIQQMLFGVNNFTATTENLEVIDNSDFIFTFVPTPPTIDGNYDTSKVFEVVSDFYSASARDLSVFNKKFIIGSTTNPGDVEQIQQNLSKFSIQVAYNPKFIEYDEMVKGIEQSDIVLIGTEYNELSNELIQLHKKLQTIKINAYVMSAKAAEIAKIGVNGFLTTKISYANMIGEIMIKAGIKDEIDVVLNAIGGDTMVGKKYMKYGFGFGGPFLPKDNRVLSHYGSSLGMELILPLSVDNCNKEHAVFLKDYYIQQNPNKMIPFVMNHISYKKGTDILEESQQFQLCIDLLNEGYTLHVIEITEIAKKLISLSESYNNRLKFFPIGTKPEGYEIKLN